MPRVEQGFQRKRNEQHRDGAAEHAKNRGVVEKRPPIAAAGDHGEHNGEGGGDQAERHADIERATPDRLHDGSAVARGFGIEFGGGTNHAASRGRSAPEGAACHSFERW